MTISKKIEKAIAGSSFIRKMFTEGARLKAEHGAENVFDFTLGNPNLPPPDRFKEVLKETVESMESNDHGYMPNVGYPETRAAIAKYLSEEQGVPVTGDEIIMTVGAGGALNTILKAILDPGDEVITPVPCFVEYGFYTDNFGGILKKVPSNPDFTLNMQAISDGITDKTKVVLINSPNNPTGQVYSEESLNELSVVLTAKGKELNRTIYLVSDEPYRKVIYDGIKVPSIFACYKDSIIATSYSKDLSIPGERIGLAAVNPKAEYRNDLLAAMAITNRIIGFVNAPALMQRVVARLQGISVDALEYKRKRDILCDGLADAGYEFITPPGAFYLFPKSPIEDDVKFVAELQEELILTVPGTGFFGPGHFRIAFCVDDQTIINALPGFKKIINKFK